MSCADVRIFLPVSKGGLLGGYAPGDADVGLSPRGRWAQGCSLSRPKWSSSAHSDASNPLNDSSDAFSLLTSPVSMF